MKRTRKEVRKAILEVLKDGKEHSYGELERRVNTNWQTIRDHCEELQLFEALEVSKGDKVKIAKKGREILKKI